jgi:hypothetical protein
VVVSRSMGRVHLNMNMRFSIKLEMYLQETRQSLNSGVEHEIHSPGGVVIIGSQVVYLPSQYACACGTWNGSSFHDLRISSKQLTYDKLAIPCKVL